MRRIIAQAEAVIHERQSNLVEAGGVESLPRVVPA